MIHHVSIPVRDPNHVAKVLSELTGWKARPFMGPIPGAIMVLSEDRYGTAIELYPEETVFSPGAGDEQGEIGHAPAPAAVAFHALISLDVDPDDVLRIAEREGWRALRCWRGPPHKPLFELIEFWIENRLMLEIATPDMLPNYLKVATAEAHDRMGAEMRMAVQARTEPA